MTLTSGLARRQQRPGMDNPVLDYMRDEYGRGCDIWGLATTWQFAVADHLTRFDLVPAEWGFRPSPFGADKGTSEYQHICQALVDVDQNRQIEYLLHAGRVFDRLAQQAHRAGLSYGGC